MWADLVVQSVLGTATDNQASLVLPPAEQFYSLPKRKETRLLLHKNAERLGKRHGKAYEVGDLDHEFLLDSAVGTVTLNNLMYPVKTKGKTEIKKEKAETIEMKSVKMRRMAAQNTCRYNLGNNKNFD